MKNRIGFVSNSSSSSFIIQKSNLSDSKIMLIKEHQSNAQKLNDMGVANFDCIDDAWQIIETDETISGVTTMDNFNMTKYLLIIGVDNVIWDEY
jgi:hypothetical protein